MKVIDLLNKIANGEEVPKKIIVDRLYYEYDKNVDYKNDNKYLFDNYLQINEEDMNKEIEILEESKGIPEKLYHCCMETDNEETKFLIKNMNDLVDRYNEIIDYLESKGKSND